MVSSLRRFQTTHNVIIWEPSSNLDLSIYFSKWKWLNFQKQRFNIETRSICSLPVWEWGSISSHPSRGYWARVGSSQGAVVLVQLLSHGSQQAAPPCPSLPPRVCSHSCPLSQWCQWVECVAGIQVKPDKVVLPPQVSLQDRLAAAP